MILKRNLNLTKENELISKNNVDYQERQHQILLAI